MSDSIASELLQKWVSAIKGGDPNQVTDLYRDDDAILLGTFSNIERVGRDLIFEYFKNLLKSPVDVEIVSEHPHVYVGSAVNSGHYNFVTNGKTINARFSFIWKASPWEILSHHSSVMPET